MTEEVWKVRAQKKVSEVINRERRKKIEVSREIGMEE